MTYLMADGMAPSLGGDGEIQVPGKPALPGLLRAPLNPVFAASLTPAPELPLARNGCP